MIVKKECAECHKFFKHVHMFQDDFFCYKCYQKAKKPLLLYDRFLLSPVTCRRTIHLSFTKQQNEKLIKRVEWLTGNNKHGFSQYVKTLILYDLNSWRENDGNKRTR